MTRKRRYIRTELGKKKKKDNKMVTTENVQNRICYFLFFFFLTLHYSLRYPSIEKTN